MIESSPFTTFDKLEQRITDCEATIADQQRTIQLLTQSVTLLMQLCNRRMSNDAPKIQ